MWCGNDRSRASWRHRSRGFATRERIAQTTKNSPGYNQRNERSTGLSVERCRTATLNLRDWESRFPTPERLHRIVDRNAAGLPAHPSFEQLTARSEWPEETHHDGVKVARPPVAIFPESGGF